jgi:CubicO group peptidase (beta-lactamase class C family)
LFVAFLTCASNANSQTQASFPEAAHNRVDTIFAPFATGDMPGCAVGVSRNGALDFARGYGLANLEHAVPISPETRFHVASVSKQFTAFSIFLLEQEGRLSLDDDIRIYLPDMPDYGQPVTIGQLMYHTAGLREQGMPLNLSGWRSDDVYTQDDMLRVISRQRRLNFVPGSEVSYTNSGYTLLAEIVRRVSGQPLPSFARERIFAPLGMGRTHFREVHNEVVEGRASAYYKTPDGAWRFGLPAFEHYGSTNLVSTVGDLLKWQQNLVDGRIGGEQVRARMLTSGTLGDGTTIEYGGGLRLRTYRGLKTIGHDGLDGAFRADTVLFPDQRLAVTVLCNNSAAVPDELSRKVAEAYLGDSMRDDIKPAVVLPEDALQALAGTYWSPQTDEVIRLHMRTGALRQNGGAASLVPVGGQVFRDGETTREWRFRRNGRSVELSVVDYWPTARVFKRVDEPMPTPEALNAYAGRYHSDDTGTDYAVQLKDGKLSLQWLKQPGLLLEPIGGDRFISSSGWTVSFTRSQASDVNGLDISTRRVRRLHFERVGSRAR